jgi:ABC-2 type transport system ATP-binding protein
VSSSAIEAHDLTKAFGTTTALADVELSVQQGEVVALLGPNGAGKTTLVRILTTLLRPDGGWARVVGLDVVRDAPEVRASIGLSGQLAAVDDLLTGRENLEMVARLYHLGARETHRRVDEALEQFTLTDAADQLAKAYSGGMRRRLDLAAALIGRPQVLMLDEPTTGLDPRTRLDTWAITEDLVAEGTTLLLTTQYLEEADRLAHQIVVLDRGRIAAEGTADQLKDRLGGDVVEIKAGRATDIDRILGALAVAFDGAPTVDAYRQSIAIPAPDGVQTLQTALRCLDRADVVVHDIAIRRPSLDDVFLALTGRPPDGEEPDSTERRET